MRKEKVMWFLEKPYILFTRIMLVLIFSLSILAVTVSFLLLMLWAFVHILKTNASNYLLAYVPVPILGFLMVLATEGFVTCALNSETIRRLWHGVAPQA